MLGHMSDVWMITGATAGFGRALAEEALAAGHTVVAAVRRPEAMDLEHERLSVVQLDVTDGATIPEVVAGALEQHGRIDVLVNNAGTGSRAAAVQDVREDDWRRVVDTNLTGSFLCAQAAYDLMLRQDPKGGRIINNGSISAHVPRPQGIAYTASKHAITGLTKGLELEGRPHGITACQIDIGNAATAMTARMEQGVLQPDGSIATEPTFDPKIVADFVVRIAELPTSVAVPTLTVMAAGMPYVGRG